MASSKTSRRWPKEHFDDLWVRWRSFIRGDFTEGAVGDRPVGLVISDMAPI